MVMDVSLHRTVLQQQSKEWSWTCRYVWLPLTPVNFAVNTKRDVPAGRLYKKQNRMINIQLIKIPAFALETRRAW